MGQDFRGMRSAAFLTMSYDSMLGEALLPYQPSLIALQNCKPHTHDVRGSTVRNEVSPFWCVQRNGAKLHKIGGCPIKRLSFCSCATTPLRTTLGGTWTTVSRAGCSLLRCAAMIFPWMCLLQAQAAFAFCFYFFLFSTTFFIHSNIA